MSGMVAIHQRHSYNMIPDGFVDEPIPVDQSATSGTLARSDTLESETGSDRWILLVCANANSIGHETIPPFVPGGDDQGTSLRQPVPNQCRLVSCAAENAIQARENISRARLQGLLT